MLWLIQSLWTESSYLSIETTEVLSRKQAHKVSVWVFGLWRQAWLLHKSAFELCSQAWLLHTLVQNGIAMETTCSMLNHLIQFCMCISGCSYIKEDLSMCFIKQDDHCLPLKDHCWDVDGTASQRAILMWLNDHAWIRIWDKEGGDIYHPNTMTSIYYHHESLGVLKWTNELIRYSRIYVGVHFRKRSWRLLANIVYIHANVPWRDIKASICHLD